MKTLKPLLIPIILLTLASIPFARASPALNITLTTDKKSYLPLENVNIYGNLTWNGSPVGEGLVALEVKNPFDGTVFVRTLQTGPTAPTGLIKIVDFYPSDMFGNPKSQFTVGELAFFTVKVNNTDSKPHSVLITINAHDAFGVAMGVASMGPWNMTPGVWSFTPSVPIPATAYTGNATAYAGVYTGWPKNGGIPYSPENSTTYEIVAAGGITIQGPGISTETNPTVPGTYNLTFKLSTEAKAGTYTAYVSSSYGGENITKNTTFNLAFLIVIAGQPYYILTESNSTLYNFAFNETYMANSWRGQLSFNVTGPDGTTGYCNVTIPKNLTRVGVGESWLILEDDVGISYSVGENDTHTWLYFTYTHPTHKIQISGTWVVPEFPTAMIIPLLIIATLAAAILGKKWSTRRRNYPKT